MLLRLEEKWHKWIFCSEDVMDLTVWPASTMNTEEWGKKGGKFPYCSFLLGKRSENALCNSIWVYGVSHSYSSVFCKSINNFFPLTQDGFLGIWFVFLGNRCNVWLKRLGLSYTSFLQLELNFLIREWTSEEMYPNMWLVQCRFRRNSESEKKWTKPLKQEK